MVMEGMGRDIENKRKEVYQLSMKSKVIRVEFNFCLLVVAINSFVGKANKSKLAGSH